MAAPLELDLVLVCGDGQEVKVNLNKLRRATDSDAVEEVFTKIKQEHPDISAAQPARFIVPEARGHWEYTWEILTNPLANSGGYALRSLWVELPSVLALADKYAFTPVTQYCRSYALEEAPGRAGSIWNLQPHGRSSMQDLAMLHRLGLHTACSKLLDELVDDAESKLLSAKRKKQDNFLDRMAMYAEHVAEHGDGEEGLVAARMLARVARVVFRNFTVPEQGSD